MDTLFSVSIFIGVSICLHAKSGWYGISKVSLSSNGTVSRSFDFAWGRNTVGLSTSFEKSAVLERARAANG
jgi:hypothetical protein